MRLFQPKIEKNSSEYVLQKFTVARFGLVVAVAFTVANMILSFLNTNVYFVFSLSLPYYLSLTYGLGDIVYILLPVALLAAYVLCWFFSKQKAVFLVVGLILFLIDCLFLAYISYWLIADGSAFYLDFLLDYLCHAWILFDLIVAACYSKRYQAIIHKV